MPNAYQTDVDNAYNTQEANTWTETVRNHRWIQDWIAMVLVLRGYITDNKLMKGWGWNTGDVVALQPRTLMVGDTTMNNNNRRSTPSVASLSSHRDLLVGNEEEKELMLSTSNISEDSLEHGSAASSKPRFSFSSLSNRVRAHCASVRNPLKITLLFLTGIAIMALIFVPVFTLHFFSYHSPQNSSNLVCVVYYANCAFSSLYN